MKLKRHGAKVKLCCSEKSSHNEDCVSSTGQRSDNVAVIGAQTLLDNEKYAAGTGQERNFTFLTKRLHDDYLENAQFEMI